MNSTRRQVRIPRGNLIRNGSSTGPRHGVRVRVRVRLDPGMGCTDDRTLVYIDTENCDNDVLDCQMNRVKRRELQRRGSVQLAKHSLLHSASDAPLERPHTAPPIAREEPNSPSPPPRLAWIPPRTADAKPFGADGVAWSPGRRGGGEEVTVEV